MKRRRAVIFPPSIATSKNHSLRRGTSLGASFGGKKPRLLPQRSRACVPRASRKQETTLRARKKQGNGKSSGASIAAAAAAAAAAARIIAPRFSASTRRLFLFSGSPKTCRIRPDATSSPLPGEKEEKARMQGAGGEKRWRTTTRRASERSRPIDGGGGVPSNAARLVRLGCFFPRRCASRGKDDDRCCSRHLHLHAKKKTYRRLCLAPKSWTISSVLSSSSCSRSTPR